MAKKDIKPKKSKKLNVILFLASIALFIYIVYLFGTEAIEILKLNVNFWYLGLFVLMAFISFIPYTMRFKVILNAYGKKTSFWMLFRQTLAGFSVSYITPFSRFGGEPIRIYMLKKEANIDYKTASSAVILDKYVEILGGVFFLIAGLILVLSFPNSPLLLKIILVLMSLIIIFVLLTIYFRGRKNKGYFSTFFSLFRLHKIKKISHWFDLIIDVEKKMDIFFKHHKKNFFQSCFFYILTAITHIILMKVLLLSIGFNFTIIQIILIIATWGLLNFVPTPAGLGSLEAGQSALFVLLAGNGSIGFAMTLILRLGYLVTIAIGFYFLTQFSRRQILKNNRYLRSK